MNYSVNNIQEGQLFDWLELINIGHALGHKWWMVGTKLRIPEDVLDQIAASNNEVGDCGACLLREWLAHDPIWSELITVLETPAVGLGEVAANIRMKLVREASKGHSGYKVTVRPSHGEYPLFYGIAPIYYSLLHSKCYKESVGTTIGMNNDFEIGSFVFPVVFLNVLCSQNCTYST